MDLERRTPRYDSKPGGRSVKKSLMSNLSSVRGTLKPLTMLAEAAPLLQRCALMKNIILAALLFAPVAGFAETADTFANCTFRVTTHNNGTDSVQETKLTSEHWDLAETLQTALGGEHLYVGVVRMADIYQGDYSVTSLEIVDYDDFKMGTVLAKSHGAALKVDHGKDTAELICK